MYRYKVSLAVLLLFLGSTFISTASAQNDDLAYNLLQAEVKVDEPFKGNLEVRFDGSFPKPYEEAANDPGGDPFSVPVPAGEDWIIQSITTKGTPNEVAGEANWLKPVSVVRANRNDPNVRVSRRLVILLMGNLDSQVPGSRATIKEKLDPTTHRITVTFRQVNFPAVTVGGPPKKGAKKVFVAAKGKTDADIYLSGMATGTRGSKPAYSIETKLQYLQRLRRAGALGGKFTLVSDEASDIDPDSITASGTYEKIFVFGMGTGLILNSDFIGTEFDKKDKTRNLTTNLEGTFVLPSARLTETLFATAEFLGGFEGGKNFKSEMDANGLGGFWRLKFGANAYLLALNPPLFSRITFSTEYKVRLPRDFEPFTEIVDGQELTSLTKKPRHYVGSDLDLLFTPAYGLSLKYRYGSLPPAFKLVDHKVSIGFTLKLKQTNK